MKKPPPFTDSWLERAKKMKPAARRARLVKLLKHAHTRITVPDPGRTFVTKLQREFASFCIEEALALLRLPPYRRPRR